MSKEKNQKKNVYTIPELSMRMQGMFNMFNEHCFGGKLPKVIITYEQGRKQKAYGWIYSGKTWKQGNEYKYNIVISVEWLDDLDNVLITLLHEMCHLYAMENNIKDTSRNGRYHNNEFKTIAESAGLVCTRESQGWATRSMSDELKQWLETECPIKEIRLKYEEPGTAPKPEEKEPEEEAQEEPESEQKPKKKSGYYNYICPECKAKARTTKLAMIACMGIPEEQHMPKMMMVEG